MKKLHPKQILRANERAHKDLRRKQTFFLLGLLTLLALVAVAGIFFDPTFSPVGLKIFGGTGLAVMAIIGDVGDVADMYATGDAIFREVYLIDVDEQIDPAQTFPLPNSSRQVGTIPMLSGQYMKKFSAHSFPSFTGTGEKGDIVASGSNVFEVVMAGFRAKLLTFAEEHIGKRFIIIYRETDSTDYYILGSYDRPVIFKSHEAKNDKDGRYVSFKFERSSIKMPYLYTGSIVTQAAGAHTAGVTTLAITAGQDVYTIPNGSSATYAINAISGLTASDKGRTITLYGSGTNYSATIADSSTFTLEDGTTWTAKAGSKLVLRVLDSATLVEVQGSRVQTA